MKPNTFTLILFSGLLLTAFSFTTIQQPWEVPAKYKKMENPTKASKDDMDILVEYLRVEDRSFPEMLIGNGWLDMVGNGYYIHDWHDHADEATKKVLLKRGETFANGSPVRLGTRGTGNEPEGENDSLPGSDSGENDSRQPKPKPKPKPKPYPKPYPEPKPGASAGAKAKPSSLDEVITRGKEIDLPESECKAFWFYYDSLGWKIKGKPMEKWKAALAGWKTRYEAKSQEKSADQPKIYTKAEREARKLAQGELDEF